MINLLKILLSLPFIILTIIFFVLFRISFYLSLLIREDRKYAIQEGKRLDNLLNKIWDYEEMETSYYKK